MLPTYFGSCSHSRPRLKLTLLQMQEREQAVVPVVMVVVRAEVLLHQIALRAQWMARSATIFARLNMLLEGTPAGVIARFAEEKMNGVEAWRALENKYEHRGTAGKSFLHGKMIKAKFDSKGDPDEYFQVLESCQYRLRQLQA